MRVGTLELETTDALGPLSISIAWPERRVTFGRPGAPGAPAIPVGFQELEFMYELLKYDVDLVFPAPTGRVLAQLVIVSP
jgi:hypothetical protein